MLKHVEGNRCYKRVKFISEFINFHLFIILFVSRKWKFNRILAVFEGEQYTYKNNKNKTKIGIIDPMIKIEWVNHDPTWEHTDVLDCKKPLLNYLRGNPNIYSYEQFEEDMIDLGQYNPNE